MSGNIWATHDEGRMKSLQNIIIIMATTHGLLYLCFHLFCCRPFWRHFPAPGPCGRYHYYFHKRPAFPHYGLGVKGRWRTRSTLFITPTRRNAWRADLREREWRWRWHINSPISFSTCGGDCRSFWLFPFATTCFSDNDILILFSTRIRRIVPGQLQFGFIAWPVLVSYQDKAGQGLSFVACKKSSEKKSRTAPKERILSFIQIIIPFQLFIFHTSIYLHWWWIPQLHQLINL